MKRWLAVGAVLVTFGAATRAVAAPDVDPSRAIVKLYVTTVARDLLAPWRSGSSYGVTGSGVLIADGRILTAAHVVNDQTFVQVRPNGAARKYRARVTFVSHVTDLALLEVDDPAFHQGMTRLELGELPAVRGQVAAYGFPNGARRSRSRAESWLAWSTGPTPTAGRGCSRCRWTRRSRPAAAEGRWSRTAASWASRCRASRRAPSAAPYPRR